MEFHSDTWLAEIFGKPVFRATLCATDAAPDIGEAVQAHAAKHRDAFWFLKLETEHVAQLGALEAAGFRVVDVNVEYSRPTDPAPPGAADTSISVGDARPDEHDAILDIAHTCFSYTRFHQDPAVPETTANQVKRRWIASYLDGARGEQLYAARIDGHPVGFLAVLTTRSNADVVSVIDLVGVDRGHQRRGVGQALTCHFIDDWRGRAAELRVGTQVANIPSIRMYTRLGFRISRSQYVLHRHTP